MLVIKIEIYFGSSFSTLIFAVRFLKKALVLNTITYTTH